ncbi:ATP synthase F1 subunit gamma [Candidatus Giovannonibacteria bacterium]|nr:ATP synthase F1 subunit gamma [Candidatus Giovannonibacteria bacterium]
MESLQAIKNRLGAVKNIGQITKAMEVVAATKMRRAQELALNSRSYAFKALDLLEKLSREENIKFNLAQAREVSNTLVVIISSDRGLAGPFNSQIARASDKFFDEDPHSQNPDHKFLILSVGRKALAYAKKKHFEIADSFSRIGDFARLEEVGPLEEVIINGFESGKWDRVVTISMHFRTTLKQEVLSRQILPVDFSKIRETVYEIVPEHGRFSEISRENLKELNEPAVEYIFEPTRAEAIKALIPHLIKMQLYHLILEANASEHSARRVAMKAACDNAEEIFSKLTLSYNKARQAYITNEMVEITSTQSALN